MHNDEPLGFYVIITLKVTILLDENTLKKASNRHI